MQNFDVKHLLSQTDFFAGQSGLTLDELIRHALPLSIAKGGYVFQEGDHVASIYLLLAGRVQSFVADRQGRKFVLMFGNAGELMGEVSYLDGGPAAWSVQAEEDCRLLQFRRADLIRAFGTADGLPSEAVRNKILMRLAALVRRMSTSAKNLALLDVYGRIRLLFNDYLVEENGQLQLEKVFTQQEIADQIGSSREMVARILKELVFGHYIRMENRRIVLLKMLPEHF